MAVLAIVVIVSVFASRKEEPEVVVIKLENRPELKQTVTASRRSSTNTLYQIDQ